MKSVGVLTRDKYLFRKIELDLGGDFECLMTEDTSASFDFVFADIDRFPSAPARAIRMSRTEECELSIPFAIGAAKDIILGERAPSLSLDSQSRCARLKGQVIKLTKLEFSLLSLLFSAGGEFVSREEISSCVWDGEATGTLINLYVHYLRAKLESDGRRIILSSRNGGYAIDKKYLGGR